MRASTLFALALAWMVLSGCLAREHPLEEGLYRFTLDPGVGVTDDGCALISGGTLDWTGSLTVSGDFLRLGYDPLEVTMVGSYGEVSDDFQVAGTRGPIELSLPSGRCDVEIAQVLMDGSTDSANAFHGALQVRYEKRNSDACSCKSRFSYRATQ